MEAIREGHPIDGKLMTNTVKRNELMANSLLKKRAEKFAKKTSNFLLNRLLCYIPLFDLLYFYKKMINILRSK